MRVRTMIAGISAVGLFAAAYFTILGVDGTIRPPASYMLTSLSLITTAAFVGLTLIHANLDNQIGDE